MAVNKATTTDDLKGTEAQRADAVRDDIARERTVTGDLPLVPTGQNLTVEGEPGETRLVDIGPADPDKVETVKLTAPSGTKVTVPKGAGADSLKAIGYK